MSHFWSKTVPQTDTKQASPFVQQFTTTLSGLTDNFSIILSNLSHMTFQKFIFCLWGSWITVIPPAIICCFFPQNLSLLVLKLGPYSMCVWLRGKKVHSHAVWTVYVCMSSSVFLSLPPHRHSTNHRKSGREETRTWVWLTTWHHSLPADWLLLESGGFISYPGATDWVASSSLSGQRHRGKPRR